MRIAILLTLVVSLSMGASFCFGQRITLAELKKRHAVAIETALKNGKHVSFLGEKYNAISNLNRFSRQTEKLSLRTKFIVLGKYECTMDSDVAYEKDSFEVTKVHFPNYLIVREVSSVEVVNKNSVKSITFAGHERKLSDIELRRFIEDGWNFESLGLSANEEPVPGIELIIEDIAKLYPQSSAKKEK